MFAALLLAPTLADRVLVIENTNSPASVEIAEDYARRRKVKQVLKVQCPETETLAYGEFKSSIQQPLEAYLKGHKVDFIVLTKGIPIRLTDAGIGMFSKQPSLDSFIAALGYAQGGRKVTLLDTGFTGTAFINRFFNSKERFSHAKFGGYLVTRLDGYTPDEAKMLTAFALQSEKARPTGPILLDVAEGFGVTKAELAPISTDDAAKEVKELPYSDWNGDLVSAGTLLSGRKIPVQVDRTPTFVGGLSDLMGYASWGSNDPGFKAEGYLKLRFAPGAIAETAVSTSARTFLPTAGGQSLIADLVRGRITGVKGYVDEPLLQAVASPTVLFDRYTSGWTLAESFYAASRFVGWEDIVIGDPLCSPYAAR